MSELIEKKIHFDSEDPSISEIRTKAQELRDLILDKSKTTEDILTHFTLIQFESCLLLTEVYGQLYLGEQLTKDNIIQLIKSHNKMISTTVDSTIEGNVDEVKRIFNLG